MKLLQKIGHSLSVITICTIFQACESVVEVPIPAHTPKLALRYMLGNETPDTTHYQFFPQYQPYVNHSQSILANGELNGVNDAILTLTNANGQVVETFRKNNTFGYGAVDDGYYEPVTRFKAEPGQTYFLSASAPGYETATAKLTLPGSVPGLQASFVKQGSDLYGMNGRVTVTLPDDGKENNYYVLYGVLLDDRYVANPRDYFREETDEDGMTIGTEFQDIHFSQLGYSEASPFDDKTFNGRTISFARDVNMYIGNPNTPPKYLRIFIHSITEDTYKFLKSMETYYETNGNPFAEPTRVLGNMKNGYGYFGGFTSSYVDIELPK